jgi:hypothetical protein
MQATIDEIAQEAQQQLEDCGIDVAELLINEAAITTMATPINPMMSGPNGPSLNPGNLDNLQCGCNPNLCAPAGEPCEPPP